MEAEAPMQNDDRDPRDLAPEDEPGGQDSQPPVDGSVSDEPTPPVEPVSEAMPPADESAAESDGEDEFETAAWPGQDSVAAAAAADAARMPPSDVEAVPPAPPADVTPPSVGPEDALPAHTVPATEPGESTQCPRCGTENRPGIAFCRNCGQRLVAAGAPTTVARPEAPEGTRACPRCGTHNRAGVAFCQNCGANLRAAEAGGATPAASELPASEPRGGALLGPIVLLIGAVGIAVAWLLPFAYGSGGSLFDRAFGAPGGYGIAFWNGYGGISGLSAQSYFGFAAPAPLLVALLAVLAVAGFLRARPGILQIVGLAGALVWAIGLAALFVIEELLGGPGGGLVEILSALTPGGIIFLLASMIVVIGTLTRFGRS
jgi:Double zinc ribbon